METLFSQIDYWHWWVLAGAMLLIEVLAPSFFFLWLSVAAAVVGLVMLGIPDLDWQYQIMIFSGLSVISIVLFRRYQRLHPASTDQPGLNRRGEQYIGRVFTLDQPIVNHIGSIRVDDTSWRISGEDMPTGTQVTVSGTDGAILKVSHNNP